MDVLHVVLFSALIANVIALVIGMRCTRRVGKHETARTELRHGLLPLSERSGHGRGVRPLHTR